MAINKAVPVPNAAAIIPLATIFFEFSCETCWKNKSVNSNMYSSQVALHVLYEKYIK